tara:strand:+ start:176 stop:463 length:288 start_codon:yes stop_codon:yes gene_type:complete
VKKESLSQLIKDYSTGRISSNEYYQEREKLIKDIVAGRIIIEEVKYVPHKNKKNKKTLKELIKIINLQNKRPLYLAIIILSLIFCILVTSVFFLR